MYYYESSVGTFWIVPNTEHPGSWLLGIDDERLGNYAHAWQAAVAHVPPLPRQPAKRATNIRAITHSPTADAAASRKPRCTLVRRA